MFRRTSILHRHTTIAVVALPALAFFMTAADVSAQVADARAQDSDIPPQAHDTRVQDRVPGLDLRAQFGLGHDTNSFREATTVDAGSFFPYDLRARYEPLVRERSTLRLTSEASGEEYVGAVSDGGERDFGLGAEWSHRLLGDGRRHSSSPTLRVEAHGAFEINRRKYISRADGEEYTVDSQGVPIPFGDRYNSRDLEAGTEIALEWPRDTEWRVRYDLRHRNYDEDHTDIADVDRLDNRRSDVGLRLTREIGRPLRLRAEYSYQITDYYDRSVHDLQGAQVQGVGQTFYRNRWSGEVRWRAGRAVRASLEACWATRRDPYQGYYDSQEWSIEPQLQFDATSRLEIEVGYGYVHRTYDLAHVGFDALRPLRDDRGHEISVETTYQLNPRGAVFFVVQHDNVDEMNPIYSYDRTRSWVGYELRY